MTAIIIDDEENAITVLRIVLAKRCPDVAIVATTTSSVEGVALIRELRPDILFLDIEMPQLNGFQLLEQVADVRFHLIFTTAYDQYALRAFRYSAVDYLLKPVAPDELEATVRRLGEGLLQRDKSMDLLQSNMVQAKARHLPGRILLPHARGFAVEVVDAILYCEASNMYTRFFFTDKEPILVSKPLADIETMLESELFFRVHRQYLVQVSKIKEIIRSDGGYLIMQNGQEIPVARNRKQDLLMALGLGGA